MDDREIHIFIKESDIHFTPFSEKYYNIEKAGNIGCTQTFSCLLKPLHPSFSLYKNNREIGRGISNFPAI